MAHLVTYPKKWLSVLTILNCSFLHVSNGCNNRNTSEVACEEMLIITLINRALAKSSAMA